MKTDQLPEYLVSRVNSNNETTGLSHVSENVISTLCGVSISNKWVILGNQGDRVPECQKCLKACGGQ